MNILCAVMKDRYRTLQMADIRHGSLILHDPKESGIARGCARLYPKYQIGLFKQGPSRNRYRPQKMVYNHHQCWRRSLFSLFKKCEWLQGSESILIKAAQGQPKCLGRDEA